MCRGWDEAWLHDLVRSVKQEMSLRTAVLIINVLWKTLETIVWLVLPVANLLLNGPDQFLDPEDFGTVARFAGLVAALVFIQAVILVLYTLVLVRQLGWPTRVASSLVSSAFLPLAHVAVFFVETAGFTALAVYVFLHSHWGGYGERSGRGCLDDVTVKSEPETTTAGHGGVQHIHVPGDINTNPRPDTNNGTANSTTGEARDVVPNEFPHFHLETSTAYDCVFEERVPADTTFVLIKSLAFFVAAVYALHALFALIAFFILCCAPEAYHIEVLSKRKVNPNAKLKQQRNFQGSRNGYNSKS